MKEILYIQAGSHANYIGTHFWNTQETYLASEEPEIFQIQHDVSFTEIANGATGQSTFCPRAILFDRKSNFGSLTKSNSLGAENIDLTGHEAPWSGDIHEFRHTAIPKSNYHIRLEETGGLGVVDEDRDQVQLLENPDEIRYWSDFSRVFYDSRSIQSLPDPLYGERLRGDWKGGHEFFYRCNEDTCFMDESVRHFLEECDFFQGLHILNDVDTFGGFTDAFLTHFHDEFSKASSLVFPVLSDALLNSSNVHDTQVAASIANDALYLRSLSEMSSTVLPIQNPSVWPSDSWLHLVNFDKSNKYQTSALVSTVIESSTLPLRFNGSRQDLQSFCTQARRYGSSVFCQISGVVPVAPSATFDRQRFSFSDKDLLSISQEWNRMDVARGFSPPILNRYDEWCAESNSTGAAVSISTVNAFAHPLPSSYPAIFGGTSFVDSPYKGTYAPRAVAVLSSISTGSGTAKMLSGYAKCLRASQRLGVLNAASLGLENDEVRELIDDLWRIHDGYSVDTSDGGDESE